MENTDCPETGGPASAAVNVAQLRSRLGDGLVIPACPLALNRRRKLDERRQRALLRYYHAAGAGGIAVGVHTTQFAIRQAGLLRPVLALAAETTADFPGFLRIAGICGLTKQALAEASLARELGYDAGLLSLGAWRDATEARMLAHCRAVSKVIPIVGFYLQASVGGRVLPHSFWRRFAEIENVVAIKMAPFNRYQTIDVIRAVAEAGRPDIALYTGNDDNIVIDLLTQYRFRVGAKMVQRRVVGGLLGHWAVWTRNAVQIQERCHWLSRKAEPIPPDLLRLNAEVTDMNSAVFDTANDFAGCIAGIHEVLRRQGLLEGTWCLDPAERLSRGQAAEIDRVCRAYPHLVDDDFVRMHRAKWLNG
jgi:dihydrodipicolinate synthase/N-acetylneuraminate lyase